MGSLLLAAGAHGMRHSLPNARIMVHQPSGSAGGQATDIQIQAEEIIKLKRQLNGIYVKHTKQPLAYIEARYSNHLNTRYCPSSLWLTLKQGIVQAAPGLH